MRKTTKMNNVASFAYRNYVYHKDDKGLFNIYMVNADEVVVSEDESEIKALIDMDIDFNGIGYQKTATNEPQEPQKP